MSPYNLRGVIGTQTMFAIPGHHEEHREDHHEEHQLGWYIGVHGIWRQQQHQHRHSDNCCERWCQLKPLCWGWLRRRIITRWWVSCQMNIRLTLDYSPHGPSITIKVRKSRDIVTSKKCKKTYTSKEKIVSRNLMGSAFVLRMEYNGSCLVQDLSY